MLCIHMILDGVCATKNIWSEYVLSDFGDGAVGLGRRHNRRG